MNPWYEITEVETDPGAPGKAELWKAWWKNPIAIAEGAPDAPRVSGLALIPDSKLLTEAPVLTVTASDAVTVAIGFTSVTGTARTTGDSNVVGYTTTATGLIVGSVRFKASHFGFNNVGSSFDSILQLFKNNVLVSTFSTGSTVAVQRSVDLSITAGDVIEWRHRSDIDSFQTGSNFSGAFETASDTYARIGGLLKWSEA